MKTSLLSLLFILLLSSCSHVQPNVESVNERSVASERCDELVALFFNKNAATLEIPSNSLLGQNKNLIQRMDSIRLSAIDYANYYQDFFALNKRAPTLRDALTYIDKIKRRTINNYDLLISDLQHLPNAKSPEVQLFIQEVSKVKSKVSQYKSIKQHELELTASYEKGKTIIPNLDTAIPIEDASEIAVDPVYFQYLKVADNLSDFQGGYGELMGMVTSKEKILMRGMKFDKIGSNIPLSEKLIAEKVSALEAKVSKMTNQEIIDFINPHKEGLLREAYRALEEENFSMANRQDVVGKIFKMIRSKEIDLVTENNQGQITWVEVKAYNKPVNMRLLRHGTKSILDQLIEHKALRDVLGLEASVKLRFVSSISVINEEATEAIEQIGYEVISAK